MNAPPKYALLRDRVSWEATLVRLESTADGDLRLLRLPGRTANDAIDMDAPWECEPSGLAIGENGRILLCDTAGNQVFSQDPRCNALTRIGGMGFSRPRGVLVFGELLYVADSGNARVQVFDARTLALRAVWQGTFCEPTGLAADREGRIYVLDAGTRTVLRLSASGTIDHAYSDAMARSASLEAPAFLAIDADDVLYVSDTKANRVFRFDVRGEALAPLEALQDALPRALCAAGSHLHVADAATGELRTFDLEAALDVGVVPGFRGPVSALALDRAGAVRVKTGLDLNTVLLQAGVGCAASGYLVAGPLDAGVHQTWERVVVNVTHSADTRVRLEVCLAPTPSGAPGEADWLEAQALDTLVPPPRPDGSSGATSTRFLWLRITIASDDRRTSPTLKQVQAATVAGSYIDHLPAVYAREDRENHFLRRWLALFRSELSDVETLLGDIARRFDPETAPVDYLQWLAEWVAFELPGKEAPSWSLAWIRELIARAHDIHTRRGTKAGLLEAIELRTGLHPNIVEAWRSRRIWQLGFGSRLGFDTALAPARADGAIVPDSASAIVVGNFVVDQSRPQEAADFGTPLFADEAHLFTVLLPAGSCPGEDERTRLRAIVDAEKPAHTDYHLCLVGCHMRVGFQARIGIDAIVAGPPASFALDVSRVGLDTFVSDSYADGAARIGYRSNIGQTMHVG